MTYSRSLGQYKKTHIETAGRLDLVLMCYEKAIEMIWQAKKLFDEKQFEEKAKRLQKAIDIIHQLQGSLNFEKGGQIAKNLDSLYTYIAGRLLEGDVNKNMAACDQVIGILGELRDAWQALASRQTADGVQMTVAQGPKTDYQQIAA